jgi:hypothetical protein
MTKKNKIRRQIKPGNSKSLLDAGRIAKEQETAQIPNKMCLDHDIFEGEHIAEAFAKHFITKVVDIKNN